MSSVRGRRPATTTYTVAALALELIERGVTPEKTAILAAIDTWREVMDKAAGTRLTFDAVSRCLLKMRNSRDRALTSPNYKVVQCLFNDALIAEAMVRVAVREKR